MIRGERELKNYESEYAEYYYLPKIPFKSLEGLWPIRAGENIAKENYRVGPKMMDCYSFHFVIDGSVTYVHAGKKVQLHKGAVYCLFPDLIYEYYNTTTDRQLKMKWIAFPKKQIEEIVQAFEITPLQSWFYPEDTQHLNESLNDIFELLKRFDDQRVEDVLRLQTALYYLMNLLITQPVQTLSFQSGDWLQKGKEYIERHYTEGITIEYVASHVGVNRSYFSERFSKTFGESPIKYLQRLRFKKGKEMLKFTNYTITEIALSLGYPNLYMFTRAFKNHMNMSPSKYRLTAKDK